MADAKHSKHPHEPKSLMNPSEAETMQLLEEALRQYEDCINLANMPDYSEGSTVGEPIYSWDNPIGLVVAEKSHAILE